MYTRCIIVLSHLLLVVDLGHQSSAVMRLVSLVRLGVGPSTSAGRRPRPSRPAERVVWCAYVTAHVADVVLPRGAFSGRSRHLTDERSGAQLRPVAVGTRGT